MKKALVVLLISLMTVVSQAQQPTLVYHPGDTIHVLITFEHPAKIDGGSVLFYLQGAPQEHQRGLQVLFGDSQFRKMSESEYEISITVPQNAASGSYFINRIDALSEGATRNYFLNNGFTNKVEIRLENPKHVNLPDIKGLAIGSGK